MVFLTYNNAYGRSIHAPSKEYAQKLGINLVAVEEFPPKTVDLNTELLRLQKAGAEYVFMQMLPSAIITAFKSADRINYSPVFLGTWTSTDPDFFKMGAGLIRDRLVIQFPGGLPSINPKEWLLCRNYGSVIKQWINLMLPTGKASLSA